MPQHALVRVVLAFRCAGADLLSDFMEVFRGGNGLDQEAALSEHAAELRVVRRREDVEHAARAMVAQGDRCQVGDEPRDGAVPIRAGSEADVTVYFRNLGDVTLKGPVAAFSPADGRSARRRLRPVARTGPRSHGNDEPCAITLVC